MVKSRTWLVLALALAGAALLIQARRLFDPAEPAEPEPPAEAPAPPPPAGAPLEGLIALQDVDYGLPGRHHPDQRLDFYQLPSALRDPSPVVILVHGGTFHSGDEEIQIREPLYRDWLLRGWSIATAQYRLAPRTCDDLTDPEYPHQSFYPEPEHDVSLVVQFLRERAEAWSLDPEKLVLRGTSAGGSLVTLVGLSDERAFQDDRQGHGGRSTRVRAIVNLGGPTDAFFPNVHIPWDFAHVGYYVDCPASQPAPSMKLLLELSPTWTAVQEPQNALNQMIAVRHQFVGPSGADLHDPNYGILLHEALRDPRVANPSSFLAWDLGLSGPTGLDPEISESDWLELQFASIPFGAGTRGTLIRPPAMALVSLGPCDALLVANCLPGATVTLVQGTSALASAGEQGEWLASPAELAWRTADARGEALFDLEVTALDGTGRKLWLQAASSDEGTPHGLALTHGLRVERP
jgi:hypothetical protein